MSDVQISCWLCSWLCMMNGANPMTMILPVTASVDIVLCRIVCRSSWRCHGRRCSSSMPSSRQSLTAFTSNYVIQHRSWARRLPTVNVCRHQLHNIQTEPMSCSINLTMQRHSLKPRSASCISILSICYNSNSRNNDKYKPPAYLSSWHFLPISVY